MTLQVQDVGYSYGKHVALQGISFTLSEGLTALLGVNGAGKSTLLSVCAGILRPGTGAASVSSRSLYGRGERQRALRTIGFMPQIVGFPGVLTPRDVVTYSGWLKGLSGARAAARAQECLSAVRLEPVMDRRCSTLSGGMTRRLALAQALVAEPDVLLLDEPSTGLDPEQRRSMVELIRGLPGSVLMSSHVVEDVADLADDVLVLDAGRLVFKGSKSEFTVDIAPDGRTSPVESAFFRSLGRDAPR